MDFSNSLLRFATSGTLIACYSIADHLARHAGGDAMRAHVRPPRRFGIVVATSLTAFYLLIRPYGGPLWDGAGNAAGIALAFVAMGLRYATRHGVARVRQPDVAARILFYIALPLAVGVPWGWLALTLPAILTSAWWCRREDQLLLERHGETWRARMEQTAHWAPRLW